MMVGMQRGQGDGEDQAASSGSGSSMTAGERGAASMGNGVAEEEGCIAGGWPCPHQQSGQKCDGVAARSQRKVSPYIDPYNLYIICTKMNKFQTYHSKIHLNFKYIVNIYPNIFHICPWKMHKF